MKRWILILLGLLASRMVFSAYVENLPQTITQPNGKVVSCFVTGDEFYHRLHDADGYTIVMNRDNGYYYYGIRLGETVVPSVHLAGEADPRKAGLEPGVRISERLYAESRAKYEVPLKSARSGSNTGTMNAICIYISFADDTAFSVNRKYFRDMWNGANQVSVKDYYLETSYNQLRIEAHHFPESPDTLTLSYIDPNPRKYYLPKSGVNPEGYEGNQAIREHALLKNAVEALRDRIPQDLELDSDGDGIIDIISFVIIGSASNEDWNTLLWPHKWSLFSYTVNIRGARINEYFLTLEKGFGANTTCHELGHVFGAPDLYHYSTTGPGPHDPVDRWCLMASTGNPPQGISGFLKYKYNKWISELPEITQSGVYSLKPLTSPTNNLYKIRSPYSKTEYFVLEYRRREGRYENSVPGTGLVIYRINSGAGNGNAGGPPDEVYVYRPGGTLSNKGSVTSAAMSAPGRTAINDKTDPGCFLWNGGAGGPGGLDLFNISAPGDSITFEVRIEPLFPPTNLQFVPVGSSIDLFWRASHAPGLSTYYIYRNGQPYDSTKQSSYRDNSIAEGQTYTYWVTGKYTGSVSGESVTSNIVTYTPLGIQQLPYREDFEQESHGWRIKGNVEGFRWGDAGSLGMQTVNVSNFLGANSVAAGLNTICSDYAITPRLNLEGKNKVFVHFDYSLKRWQQFDHLKVYCRRYYNEAWALIVDLPVSGVGAGYRWRKHNLELPADCYSGEAQIAFQYDDGNDFGYGAGIDNVVVDEEPTSGMEVLERGWTWNLYPNPAVDEVQLEFSGTVTRNITLTLLSAEGKVIWSRIRESQVLLSEKIDLRGLAAGNYYLLADTGEEVDCKLLIRQ